MIVRRALVQLAPALLALVFGPCLLVAALTGWPLTLFRLERIIQSPLVLDSLAPVLDIETKFKGLAVQKAGLNRQDLLYVFGSSELSAFDAYHPSSIFAGEPSGFLPFLIGHAGCQDLIHFVDLAALGDQVRGRKIVVIVSAQWFASEGLSETYFDGNFSPLQAYAFVFNSRLSSDLKARAASRLLSFAPLSKRYPLLAITLRGLAPQSTGDLLRAWLVRPVSAFQFWYLKSKDESQAAKFAQATTPRAAARPRSGIPPWPALLEKAEKDGAAGSTNNAFGVYDEYFTTYLAPQLDAVKGSASHSSYSVSPEYGDLRLLLDLASELGVKPLFVIVPVNGRWEDYKGFPRAERTDYYRRVVRLIRQRGYPIADFSAHEYEPYFLRDAMHLGLKGWVRVDEVLDRYYHGVL